MERICKYCGRQYSGAPGSSACPDCVAAQKKTTLRTRICRECGRSFSGGPRAWYCPECRAERVKEKDRGYHRNGPARQLGSIDQCKICGNDYIVKSGTQRYCPKCAPEQYREIDRQQSKAWYTANASPAKRKTIRQASSAAIPCVVCGKLFVPTDRSLTCSPECRSAYQSASSSTWERANRPSRNAYHKAQRKQIESAMTPEEYKAYRNRINANSRKNYQLRKSKNNKK